MAFPQAAGDAMGPKDGVGAVDRGLGGAGGVEGGASVAVQEHVIPSRLAGMDWGRLRHGAAMASGPHQQSRTALPVPEQIGAGHRRVLLDPVLAMTQQLPPPQRPRVEQLIERLQQRAGQSGLQVLLQSQVAAGMRQGLKQPGAPTGGEGEAAGRRPFTWSSAAESRQYIRQEDNRIGSVTWFSTNSPLEQALSSGDWPGG
jgi:hypothetical protein